jgi:hypothetical protein
MRYALAGVLAVHGLIHLMGFAKAFGFAALPQLKVPIPPLWGALWLAATCAFLAAALLLVWVPRWWSLAAIAGVAVSTLVIVAWWSDAKYGAVVNAVVLVAALVGYGLEGPAQPVGPSTRTMWRQHRIRRRRRFRSA